MLLLEILQHFQLLALFTSRQPHLLLPLIKHHLLDHTPSFTVQITQFGVFGLDFGCVEEVGRVGGDGGPPGHFVGFVEVDGYFLLVGLGGGFEGPCTF